MPSAFVYGTLMANEVLSKLLQRVPPSVPATLHGFSRHRVKNVVYPAIIPSSADRSVQGRVLMELTDAEVETLDTYEAEEYYRQTVEPVLEDGSKVTAEVYIWRDQFRPLLLTDEWSYDEWRAHHLHQWVDDCDPETGHPQRAGIE